jgi:quinol monooxygenase YgiN
MNIIIQHKVRDFDQWKPVFDQHADVRKRYGSTGHELYRSLDDPNETTMIGHFPSREKAEAFAADPSLKEAMERGGVIGEPRVTWVEKVESVTY